MVDGFDSERKLAELRSKRDQAWEMAGLARQDRDAADEKRHTEQAQDYTRQINDLIRE